MSLTDAGAPRRLAWLDMLRGAALVAMAIYHFTWDLALFGLIDPYTPFEPGWRYFARSIAATFLLLVGVGLILGHGGGVRWRAFFNRIGQIVAAAALITIGTYIATPDAFIFFGILHMIAAGSLAGLLLLNLPVAAVLIVAATVAGIGLTYEHPIFDQPALLWIGLGTQPARSNDFVPFFPAFAAVAVGIAMARLLPLRQFELSAMLATTRPARVLALLGRHSLIVYLLHQPILIGGLWLALSARALLGGD